MNDVNELVANCSQIETARAPMRFILLGASNLAMSLPKTIELARASWRGPAEFFVAMGHGRSYGQEAKFFGKKFSGILQCDLWSALDVAPPRATVAIVADVGNDLAYEASVEVVVRWVTETLDRLADCGAAVAINNLPIESVRGLGSLRFRVLKALLFPRCRLSREELLSRAQALSDALAQIARERKIPAISGEKSWYGIDPIHPRRSRAGTVWQRMFSALEPPERGAAWSPPPRHDARTLRRLQGEWWAHLGSKAQRSRPRAELADGTTVELF